MLEVGVIVSCKHNIIFVDIIQICSGITSGMSSSRTSVPVKQGLFNAKIHNENGRYIHRLIYELNEQDLPGHSR